MFRKLWRKFKHWVPTKENIRRQRRRKRFHKQLQRHADLWRWERRHVALAVATGLLIAFIPIPLQFLYAGFLAGLLRINVPVTVAMTAINNPFTFLPINYFIYRVGTWITGEKAGIIQFPQFRWDLSHINGFAHELKEWFIVAGKSYSVGLLTVSMTASLIGYFSVELIWRFVSWYKKNK